MEMIDIKAQEAMAKDDHPSTVAMRFDTGMLSEGLGYKAKRNKTGIGKYQQLTYDYDAPP